MVGLRIAVGRRVCIQMGARLSQPQRLRMRKHARDLTCRIEIRVCCGCDSCAPVQGQRRACRWLATPILIAVLLAGCQHGPPKESGKFRESDLVEVVKLDPAIRLDIRYATTNNFMHRPLYHQARAFLQRPAAEALVRAHQSLRARGYGLLVFDGYRPWSVTKTFWDAASEAERKIEFVANPRKGSRHNRGCAVDLSLFELSSGLEVKMPSAYDEFSERAFPTYAGGTPESRASRDLLRAAMEAQGFTVYKAEWWHFDYKDWTAYRILNVPFEKVGR